MNIQARKLILIEEFLRISDERIIAKLESLIKQENKKTQGTGSTPMSLEEFHEMIDQAKRDSHSGHIISHQDLKIKVQAWE